MKTFSEQEKLEIYEEVVADMRSRFTRYDSCFNEGFGTCFYAVISGSFVLQERGVKTLVSGGNFSWPVNLKAPAPLPSHFSFVWSPLHPHSIKSVLRGGMPELHMWIVLPETMELVDFSLGNLKQQSVKFKIKWVDPDPPKFLWSRFDNLPEGVVYESVKSATEYVGMVLRGYALEAAGLVYRL